PDTTYTASFTDRGYALLQRSPGTRPGYYGAHRDRHEAPANPSTKSGHAARILQLATPSEGVAPFPSTKSGHAARILLERGESLGAIERPSTKSGHAARILPNAGGDLLVVRGGLQRSPGTRPGYYCSISSVRINSEIL